MRNKTALFFSGTKQNDFYKIIICTNEISILQTISSLKVPESKVLKRHRDFIKILSSDKVCYSIMDSCSLQNN